MRCRGVNLAQWYSCWPTRAARSGDSGGGSPPSSGWNHPAWRPRPLMLLTPADVCKVGARVAGPRSNAVSGVACELPLHGRLVLRPCCVVGGCWFQSGLGTVVHVCHCIALECAFARGCVPIRVRGLLHTRLQLKKGQIAVGLRLAAPPPPQTLLHPRGRAL